MQVTRKRFFILCLVIMGSSIPASLRAWVTFTAKSDLGKGIVVTQTVGIESCAFDEQLIPQLKKIGKPFGVRGSDKALAVESGVGNCFLYEKYLVSTIKGDETPGEHILVELNEGNRHTIEFDRKPHWNFVVPNGGDQYFNGIYKNYLFIDSGTAVTWRGLCIYDMNNGKAIFGGSYSDRQTQIDGDNVIFWLIENAIECPDNNDVTIRKVRFNLQTHELQKTEEMKCVPNS